MYKVEMAIMFAEKTVFDAAELAKETFKSLTNQTLKDHPKVLIRYEKNQLNVQIIAVFDKDDAAKSWISRIAKNADVERLNVDARVCHEVVRAEPCDGISCTPPETEKDIPYQEVAPSPSKNSGLWQGNRKV